MLKRSLFPCLATLLGLAVLLAAQEGGEWDPALPSTLVFLRHAEKASLQERDPELSEQGAQRAERLAALFAEAGVTHLFASEFRRTQATLEPLAERLGLEVSVRPARELEDLARELEGLPGGSVALVAGHSNTVPVLVRSVGGRGADHMAEDEYDDLFVVTRAEKDCAVATLRLTY